MQSRGTRFKTLNTIVDRTGELGNQAHHKALPLRNKNGCFRFFAREVLPGVPLSSDRKTCALLVVASNAPGGSPSIPSGIALPRTAQTFDTACCGVVTALRRCRECAARGNEPDFYATILGGIVSGGHLLARSLSGCG